MQARSRLRQIALELVIVFLGVAAALAADSWRESLLEARLRDQYLARLREDLSESLPILTFWRESRVDVAAAALKVADALEDGVGDEDGLLDDVLQATAMGFNREQFGSDLTYQEMVASGSLSIIFDSEIREGVVEYYREAGWLAEVNENLPPVNGRVAELSGYVPVRLIDGTGELTPTIRQRLIRELETDPSFVRDLRSLHAQLRFHDQIFERLIPRAESLVDLIDSEIGPPS